MGGISGGAASGGVTSGGAASAGVTGGSATSRGVPGGGAVSGGVPGGGAASGAATSAAAAVLCPPVVCWGCGAAETAGAAQFQRCPKCLEIKRIPAKFCSKACFASAWPRHKQWHADVAVSESREDKRSAPAPAIDPDEKRSNINSANEDLKMLGLRGKRENYVAQALRHMVRRCTLQHVLKRLAPALGIII